MNLPDKCPFCGADPYVTASSEQCRGGNSCGKCGVPIEAVDCDACAGTGNAPRNAYDSGDDACPKCYGYGIQAWRAAP